MKKVLITGMAGFIGSNLAKKLSKMNYEIIGIDNLNDYYDVKLKRDRLEILLEGKFKNYFVDLENKFEIEKIFDDERPDIVINLAAQAGVRYSLENPHAYIDSNITGFLNILENCKRKDVEHLIYASSSSVYGANTNKPFSTKSNVDHPLSLYAATKKANELMAHTYSHLYNLPTTGLRFFTVYGPWGRPDMALFKFTKNILEEKSIDVYNNGNMMRDFTFVDDIVESISRLIEKPAQGDISWNGDYPRPNTSYCPYKIYNIGNNSPVKLLDFIEAIELKTGKIAIKNFKELQPGDVPETYADVTDLYEEINFHPQTNIQIGVGEFVDWYRNYYNI
ncbi:NAD-dependent epimerase [Macrococcus sp. EM39E]|uniref:NAD-dependent epimerase n=1 Tax=Macrococcus animalis TaxID=3395467 RepID=UPI0039BE9DEA